MACLVGSHVTIATQIRVRSNGTKVQYYQQPYWKDDLNQHKSAQSRSCRVQFNEELGEKILYMIYDRNIFKYLCFLIKFATYASLKAVGDYDV